MHMKSDLMYDKHTDDLIGYMNLDGIGNNLHDPQNIVKDQKVLVAKVVLQIMVFNIFTTVNSRKSRTLFINYNFRWLMMAEFFQKYQSKLRHRG